MIVFTQQNADGSTSLFVVDVDQGVLSDTIVTTDGSHLEQLLSDLSIVVVQLPTCSATPTA
jgi:hypothetical protein